MRCTSAEHHQGRTLIAFSLFRSTPLPAHKQSFATSSGHYTTLQTEHTELRRETSRISNCQLCVLNANHRARSTSICMLVVRILSGKLTPLSLSFAHLIRWEVNCKYGAKQMRGEQMPSLALILLLRCPALSGQIRRAAPGNLGDGRRSRAPLLAEPQAAGKRDHPETPADIMDQNETRAAVVTFKLAPICTPDPFNISTLHFQCQYHSGARKIVLILDSNLRPLTGLQALLLKNLPSRGSPIKLTCGNCKNSPLVTTTITRLTANRRVNTELCVHRLRFMVEVLSSPMARQN